MVKKKEGIGEKLNYLIDYVTGNGLRKDLLRDFIHVFATKADLQKFATKADLQSLKVDLIGEIQSIREEIGKVKKRVEQIWSALDEDLRAEHGEIEKLKRKIFILEKRLDRVELRRA